jgi:hypothetical protein
MKRKSIFPMSDAELEALSTKQLLARLRRLHQCEESLTLSDREHNAGIEFKQSAEWIAAHEQLRQVLSRREHVPKGDELVRKRLAKSQRSRTSTRRAGRYVSTRRA